MDTDFQPAEMERPAAPSEKMPADVVIAYEDLPSYRRALHTLGNIDRELTGDGVELQVQRWRFDVLGEEIGRSLASDDVERAAIVVVSASAAGNLPEAIQVWLSESLGRPRDPCGVVVALLGDADNLDDPTSSRYKSVRDATFNAGWAFLAPTAATAKPTLLTV